MQWEFPNTRYFPNFRYLPGTPSRHEGGSPRTGKDTGKEYLLLDAVSALRINMENLASVHFKCPHFLRGDSD